MGRRASVHVAGFILLLAAFRHARLLPMVNCCTCEAFALQRRRLQQLVNLLHHPLDPLAHGLSLLYERGDLAFDGILLALGSRGLALGSFVLHSKLPSQQRDLGLGCSARLTLAFYDLHCPQHLLLERLKLIHTDTGTHTRSIERFAAIMTPQRLCKYGFQLERNHASDLLGANRPAQRGQRSDQPRRPLGQLLSLIHIFLMPEHVHLLLTEPKLQPLATTLSVLKGETSKLLKGDRLQFWQSRYYDFNVFTHRKWTEKLKYIHRNPVAVSYTHLDVYKRQAWAINLLAFH